MRTLVAVSLLVMNIAAAQPPVVTGLGYRQPAPDVAPGQIVSLFVRSADPVPQPVMAAGYPLPIRLAGFEVVLYQSFALPLPVPLIAIYTVEECPAGATNQCQPLVAVTVQVPYELVPNVPGSRRPENFASLVVIKDGVPSAPQALSAVPDNAHIVNSCDTLLPPAAEQSPCQAAVTHSDGSFVTRENPARSGEVITVYLYGLGRTEERLQSGAASPSVAQPMTDVRATVVYGSDAGPVRPERTQTPLFSGLTPGVAGLYQVNIRVETPAAVPTCGPSIPSNAVVAVGRGHSFASAPLCVLP
ncbi:MAG: hypothetical protein IPM24_16070 [Bryobacterales bacterium]|nr:hypothetical protein [Bryobacterales bacterium]